MPHPALVAALAAVATLLLMPLARGYAEHRGLIDRPDPRRLHAGAIARGGGVMVQDFSFADPDTKVFDVEEVSIIYEQIHMVFCAFNNGVAFWSYGIFVYLI